ncbi:hypothetical protein D3C71_1489340 [compost metagenome]
MGLHLLDIQRVAGVAHHGFFLVGAFEFALAVHREAHGRLLFLEPVGHGGLRAGLGVQQRHRQAGQRLDQQGDHFVRAALAGGVQHQQARGGVDPHPHRALLGEGHGQQVQLGLVFQLLAFLLAGLAAGFLLDALGLFFHAAGQHAAGQHFGFDHEAQDPLAPDRLGQRAVCITARGHPAQGLFLGGTTFHEGRLCQGFFYLRQFNLPLRGNAVHDHVLEHR